MGPNIGAQPRPSLGKRLYEVPAGMRVFTREDQDGRLRTVPGTATLDA